MEKLYAHYCGISLEVESEVEIAKDKVYSNLEKYLPGIVLKDNNNLINNKGQITLKIKKCLSKKEQDGFLDIRSSDEVNIIVKSLKVYPFLILTAWTTAIDFILQNEGIYFLHSASVLVNGQGLLFWGERADGKSTLSKLMQEVGHTVIHEDRVGLNDSVRSEIKTDVPLINEKNINLLLTPKIIPEGKLRMWSLKPHSLRYELYCELTKNIRGVGAIEENIIFQSLDNKELASKRLQFCKKLERRLKEEAYFIEGTPEDICKFIKNNFSK